MGRRTISHALLMGVLVGLVSRPASAQVSLADDIIIAAQGKENAERSRKSPLGRTPGTAASPYRLSPGSSEILLGVEATRRLAPLPRLTRRPARPAEVHVPERGAGEPEHGLAPTIEPLQASALPPTSDRAGPPPGSPDDLGDEGPPNGLTLDAAIERLVRGNRDLQTKALEIPQAEADTLTVGLRSNPLLFYSSDGVPYGSYSTQRPGEINHGLSVVYPIDFSGKRRARVALAEQEKRVLEAQYTIVALVLPFMVALQQVLTSPEDRS
jgi:outer membrane protein, heavy metal efflux system